MTHCVSECASRYRMFVTVHQYLRNSSTKHRKQLCLELRTYVKLPSSLLPRYNCSFTYNSLRNDFISTKCNSLFNTRYNYLRTYENIRKISNEAKPGEKVSLFKKFKIIFKKYWRVALPVHLLTSFVWFGSCYYLIASGIDVPKFLKYIGAPQSLVEKLESSKAGNVFLAYTLFKLLTPFRYAATLGCTTLTVKFLQKRGWMAIVTNDQEIKRIYKEQKDAFKDLTASYQDKMQLKKDDLLKKKDELKEQYGEAKEGLQRSVIESKKEFKQGMKEFTAECKHIGGLIAKSVKDSYDKKPDYVAQIVNEKTKSKKKS